MRHTFLLFVSILFCAFSAHAESRTSVKDFPNNASVLSDITWADYFANSFSVAEDTNAGLNNLDHSAKVFLSLNKNLAISGNVIDSQDRTEKQQNAAILFTFVVKSSF